LAPENPYPASIDDAWSVINYVLDNEKELNVNKQKLILAGDSAGQQKTTTK
jgi:acetyl esterase